MFAIGNFDGGYYRNGRIWIGKEECCICKRRRFCLCVDGSENEYNIGYICQNCITNSFEKFYKINVEN